MNIVKARNYLLAVALALFGAGTMAQTATINFSGALVSQTCVITASTTSGSTASVGTVQVTLPTVTAAQLGAATVLGKTTFYMGVYGCVAGAANVTWTPKLYLSSATASNGYLATGVNNLVLELLDKAGSSLSLTSNPTAFPNSSFSYTGSAAATAYENAFYIQYRTIGTLGTGTFNAVSMNVLLQYS